MHSKEADGCRLCRYRRVQEKRPDRDCLNGEVTVYLTLTFVLFVSLILALVESASVQMAKNYRRADMNRALECVFAEYQKELLENYDVFAIECGYETGTYTEQNILDRLSYYGADMESIVRGGSSGIDCSRSKMSARTGIGKLTTEYQVVIPVPLFGIAPVKCSEKMKIKAWSGYEREGWMDTGNDTVYVTETGLVYHKDYHCSHLDLSIRMTHLELVEGLRNENGGKYYPCEHCVKGNGGNIYITNSGDRYHSSLSCSGLKRTIYAIPISEAAGKGACSRCGQ